MLRFQLEIEKSVNEAKSLGVEIRYSNKVAIYCVRRGGKLISFGGDYKAAFQFAENN